MARKFYVFSVAIILCLYYWNISGQILAEEAPKDLQYILESNISKWTPPEFLSQNFAYYLSGFDEGNRPIWIMEMGKWKLNILDNTTEKDWNNELDKYMDLALFNIFNSTGMKSTPDNRVNEMIAIVDMEGFGLKQIASPNIINFALRKLRVYIVGIKFAHSVYVVNTNFVAERMVSIIKPIFGSAFEKINIYGANTKAWIPKLLRNIPQDQLPEWYGGVKDFKPLIVVG